MYKKNKKAFLVLIIGVIVSSLVILKSPPDKKGLEAMPLIEYGYGSTILGFKSTKYKSVLRPQIASITDKQEGDEENLTELLADLYVREIIRLNPSGPKDENGNKSLKVPPLSSIETAEKALQEKISKGSYVNYFTEKDITVSDDNSIRNQVLYLQKFSFITEKNFVGFDKGFSEIIDDWMKFNNTDGLETYAKIATNQIDDLMALETPSLWKSFHLQNLNLWYKKLLVFNAFLNLGNDSLKTILAFQRLPDIMEETVNLQSVLENRFMELAQDL